MTERFRYSPYGLLVNGDASATPFLFNGMYGVMTDASGLYYMRARYYNPDIRRFVNRDILQGWIGEGQTLNRFAFVNGRPVNFIDPFGLSMADLHDAYWWIHKNYPELTHYGPITSDTRNHNFGGRNITEARVAVNPIIDFFYSLGIDVDGVAFGNTASIREYYVMSDCLSPSEKKALLRILAHELLHLYVNRMLGGNMNYLLSPNAGEYHKMRSFMKTTYLIVFSILANACALALIIFFAATILPESSNRMNIESAKHSINIYKKALVRYFHDNKMYPTTEQGLYALTSKPLIEPVPQNYPPKGYLIKAGDDPWGYPYEYSYRLINGKPMVMLVSFGADGKPGGKGIDADIRREWSVSQVAK